MRIVVREFMWRFWVWFLLAVALALLGSPDARAQSVPWETSYANEGLAYQGCMQAASGAAGGGTCTKSGNGYSCVSNSGWSCSHSMAGMSGSSYHRFSVACSAMPALGSGWFSLDGGSAICKDGCSYGGGGSTGGTTVTIHSGTPGAFSIKEGGGGNAPDGGVCDGGGGPSQITSPFCKTQGGLTQCVTQDGKHCAKSSSGKLFCWSPNETGTKVNGNEGATKSPADKPNNPPPIPPPNNGNWEQTGSGTTSVTNNNGDTTNYTTNNYTSSNGTEGNGGGTTNPDGSENPGDDGEGDEDKPNTVGGGSGCGEGGAPTCSGSSCTAEAFAILIQQWRARCADEQSRGEYDSDANSGAGDAAGDDTGGLLSSLWDNEGTTPTVDHNKVSIGGGLVIPTVTIFDQTWTAPPEFYDALSIIKFIVIAAFSIAGIVVLWNR